VWEEDRMRGKRDLVWTDVAAGWRRGDPAGAFPWSSAENISVKNP
jgi:ABC-type taurine transport system substrate-binding protein